MKRLSLLLAALAVVACNGERVTGVAAQNAAIKYQGAPAPANILVFVDGKEVAMELVRSMDAKTIASIEVLKGSAARARYGDRALGGVIFIETK
jgi:TonB-dependent SusC/RagA subfamily outer membrane receptor